MANLNALLDKVATQGKDMTQAEAGGGYTLAEAGPARLRFVGYYELGKVEEMFKGAKKTPTKVDLVFELSGPKHQPRDTDGGKVPLRIVVQENLHLNEKAHFFKMFAAMNAAHGNTAKHIVQLLGKEFLGTIVHRESKGKTYANIERGSIRKAVRLDEDDQEVAIKVDPPLSELKAFVWDFADPEMWDSIRIDGMYEERKDKDGKVTEPARSKNVIQERIMKSINFKACPIYDYAIGKVSPEDQARMEAELPGVQEAESAEYEDDGVPA